jgi:hypothetical protein
MTEISKVGIKAVQHINPASNWLHGPSMDMHLSLRMFRSPRNMLSVNLKIAWRMRLTTDFTLPSALLHCSALVPSMSDKAHWPQWSPPSWLHQKARA